MKAVVFKGVKDVAVEDRQKPDIQDPRDVIVKVRYTALCGRWVQRKPLLHFYTLTSVLHQASSTSTAATSHPKLAS